MEFVEAVRNLVEYIPIVAVEAFTVFIVVSFVKVSGLGKLNPVPQLSNALMAFFMNGGQLPDTDHEAKRLFMTMIVAGLMYQVWKFAKPYFAKGVDLLSDSLKKKKE